MSKHGPYRNLGPGYSIKRNMEACGWNQKDLAEILGISEKHVSGLVNNRKPITLRMARLLAHTFGGSPQFWINLDTNYRLRLEETAEEKKTAARALIYRYMPIRDMREKGWIDEDNSKLGYSIKEFWGRNDLDFDFLEKKKVACFKKSSAFKNFNSYYALTWLRKAEMEAGKISVPDYDYGKLKALGEQIPELSLKENGIKDFVKKLKSVGVKFLCLPHLQKTYTDGAAFYSMNNPVIVYTARYDRADNFWFTMAHEIGHILRHLAKRGRKFIDSLDNLDQTDVLEKQANSYAERVLKRKEILNYFSDAQRISKAKIEDCSNKLAISRSIIVGVLHYNRKMPYSSMRDLLSGVRECLELIY